MMKRVSDFIREVRILLVFVYLYGLEFSFGATAISRAFGENAYIACWFLQIVCTVCIPFFAMISLNVPEAKEYGWDPDERFNFAISLLLVNMTSTVLAFLFAYLSEALYFHDTGHYCVFEMFNVC